MNEYRIEWWLKHSILVNAVDTAAADKVLDGLLLDYADGRALKIGTVRTKPPLPPDAPAPTPAKPRRGGPPEGGGSPGTPVLAKLEFTEAVAA